jgi:hypothetical protein
VPCYGQTVFLTSKQAGPEAGELEGAVKWVRENGWRWKPLLCLVSLSFLKSVVIPQKSLLFLKTVLIPQNR